MKFAVVFSIAVAATAVSVLTACSGSPITNSAPATLPAFRTPIAQRYTLAGIDTRYVAAPQSRLVHTLLARPAKKRKVEKDFFVSGLTSDVAVYSNKSYSEIGEITSGITAADGIWVDAKGNVYVANVVNNVVEYKKGAGSPICTYTGASDPVNVTTDSKGDVYVIDYRGDVDEYAQCSNTIEKQWAVGGVEGAAVDNSGNIFVSYNLSYVGQFEEFKGGASTGTPLGATIGSAGGLILDKKGDLIADDQAGNIDVIAPPYTSAKVLVSGLSGPFRCSLNKKENLLFSANYGTTDVTVYSYPAGTPVETVPTGFTQGVYGVGESPNAVF